MKRIFLLSTMIITSFGAMNVQSLSAAPQQAETTITPAVGSAAKKLVSKINLAVALTGEQQFAVNNIAIDYFNKVTAINNAKPANADAQIAALKQTRDQKIKALLTASQLKSWEASFKE